METHAYSDDIGSITVSGATVRIDLMVQSTTEQNAAKKPKLVPVHQLIMPLDGFIRSAARMSGVVLEFEKKGLITRKAKSSDKAIAEEE